MIYSDAADRWFRDLDEVEDFCNSSGATPALLRLQLSEPVYASAIDPNDHLCDELGEDQDIPAELEDAFEKLNEAIRNYGKPLSYQPSKFALDLDSLGLSACSRDEGK